MVGGLPVLDDLGVPVHNEWSERALRNSALLPNHLCDAGDVDGEVRLCSLFTLIGTCGRLDPFDCLEWAITRLVPHPSHRALVPHAIKPATYTAARQKRAL